MRKVKNNLQTNSPALMFAQGVESLIADPLYSPSQHDAEAMTDARHAAARPDSRGNLFNLLLRQFANH